MRRIIVMMMALAPVLNAEEIGLFVMAGQSNMQGWQGDAENYPADPDGLDRQISFYWVTPGLSSSQGKWTTLQPQGGRFPSGHFGPEVTMARRFAQCDERVAIFKYTLGSTSLGSDWRAPGMGGMYDNAVAELRKATVQLEEDGHTVSVRALIWVQGESDAETREESGKYGGRLRVLLDHFRKEIAQEHQLPVILGVDAEHPWVRAHPQVVEAQQALAEEDPWIVATSMMGLEKADATHLTPRGLLEHGERLFNAYCQMAEFCYGDEPDLVEHLIHDQNRPSPPLKPTR